MRDTEAYFTFDQLEKLAKKLKERERIGDWENSDTLIANHSGHRVIAVKETEKLAQEK